MAKESINMSKVISFLLFTGGFIYPLWMLIVLVFQFVFRAALGILTASWYGDSNPHPFDPLEFFEDLMKAA
jgi:hypothetical protein